MTDGEFYGRDLGAQLLESKAGKSDLYKLKI